jgi:hypothetical protein
VVRLGMTDRIFDGGIPACSAAGPSVRRICISIPAYAEENSHGDRRIARSYAGHAGQRQ